MLLRRIIDHVKAQHWTAVGLDFVIVVLGVFLANQISDWNASRSARAQEIGYLNSMASDTSESIATLRQQISALEAQQQARRSLYSYSTDLTARIDPDRFASLILVGLYEINSTKLSRTTYESLRNSGQLRAIRDPALLGELQSIVSMLEVESRAQRAEDAMVFEISDPYLIRRFDMSMVLHQREAMRDVVIPPSPPVPQAMREREFSNIVVYRMNVADLRLENNRRLLEAHVNLARLIEARLRTLGVRQ